MTNLQAILDAGGPWQQARIIGDQLLIQGDCREVMAVLPKVDACLTDPPYGIGEGAGKSASRLRQAGALHKSVSSIHAAALDYGYKEWDSKTADDAVAVAISSAKSSIIFGGNYYSLPPSPQWLIWDKMNGASDFADCEMAWTNLSGATRLVKIHWNGCMRVERHIPRQHPTQKPIALMEWCLGFLPDARTVLDPFMGSGTTLVACQRLGRQGIGVELDADYFEIACKRVQEVVNNPPLFTIAPPKPTQDKMDL